MSFWTISEKYCEEMWKEPWIKSEKDLKILYHRAVVVIFMYNNVPFAIMGQQVAVIMQAYLKESRRNEKYIIKKSKS